MKNILEYEVYQDTKMLGDLLLELNLTYDETIYFLKEDCNFDEEDIRILFSLNEGLWSGIKNTASKIGHGISNASHKISNAYHKLDPAKEKIKYVAGRVKDHIARNKWKYGAVTAATTGIGLMAAPFALGAGHLMDRYPNS